MANAGKHQALSEHNPLIVPHDFAAAEAEFGISSQERLLTVGIGLVLPIPITCKMNIARQSAAHSGIPALITGI